MRRAVWLLGLVGCASAPTGTTLSPVPTVTPVSVVGRTSDSLIYLGVDLAQLNPRVGSHYDGFLKVRQFYLDLSPATVATWSSWMRDIGRQELQAAGYPLKVPSTLFGQMESYSGVRFALAGKPSAMTFDTYGSMGAGNNSKASVQVTWELFDVHTRAVVYTTTSAGDATTAGNSGDAIEVAFRLAMRRLLASSEFASSAAPAPVPMSLSAPAPRIDVSWRRTMPTESDIIALPSSSAARDTISIDAATSAVASLRGAEGLGSAFLITADGLAITNFHVVRGQPTLVARLSDGADRPVRILRSDSASDLALIEIHCPTNCPFLPLRQAQPAVGDEVLALGTPLSLTLSRSVTKGIISGVRRIGTIAMLQTDAAVNPGNSGGPLVNAKSRHVVGIVTSKLVAPDVVGLGFAIAAGDAMRVLGLAAR